MTPGAALGDESVRALAREILARREYARFRPLEFEWLQGLARSLADFLAWLADLWSTSPALYALLMLGLLALAAALLAHVVWSVRRALAATPTRPPARARVKSSARPSRWRSTSPWRARPRASSPTPSTWR